MKYVADKGERAVCSSMWTRDATAGSICTSSACSAGASITWTAILWMRVRAHLMAEHGLPCNARAVYCTGCAVIARRTRHRPQRKNSLQKNAPAVLTRTKTRDTMQTIKVLTGKSKASGFSYRECGMLEAAQKTKPEEHREPLPEPACAAVGAGRAPLVIAAVLSTGRAHKSDRRIAYAGNLGGTTDTAAYSS